MSDQPLRDSLPASLTKLLTVNDVADVLGCGRTMVYELIAKGLLTPLKIGRLTRITPSELDRFVRRCTGEDPESQRRPSRPVRSGDAATLTLPL